MTDYLDISEGIDLAKSKTSKECQICHYFFFNQGFKFQVLYAMFVTICHCFVLI